MTLSLTSSCVPGIQPTFAGELLAGRQDRSDLVKVLAIFTDVLRVKAINCPP